MDEITEVVHHFILKEFLPGEDPGELTDRTPLITGGILDSISTLKLVVFLEEHFGITVEAYEAGVEPSRLNPTDLGYGEAQEGSRVSGFLVRTKDHLHFGRNLAGLAEK